MKHFITIDWRPKRIHFYHQIKQKKTRFFKKLILKETLWFFISSLSDLFFQLVTLDLF